MGSNREGSVSCGLVPAVINHRFWSLNQHGNEMLSVHWQLELWHKYLFTAENGTDATVRVPPGLFQTIAVTRTVPHRPATSPSPT